MLKKNDEFKMRRMLAGISALIIIVLLISVYLYQSFQIDLIMKDLHVLHEKRNDLLSETERLQAEVDRLSNIDRVAQIARDKFDLEFSDEQALVVKIDQTDDLVRIKKQFAQQDKKIEQVKSAGIR